MIRAVLADSGPLYAANDEGDSHHQQALQELKELASDGREILIAYPILLEAYHCSFSNLAGMRPSVGCQRYPMCRV